VRIIFFTQFTLKQAPQYLGWLVVWLALAFSNLALAQENPPTAAPTEEDALYIEAIKAIAEGRKSDASVTLNRLIAKAPYHAGAFMELAMIQCQLGNEAGAEAFFTAIEQRFAPQAAIVEIIAQQRKQGCKQFKRQSHANISLGRGYEQNVNQGASNPIFTIPRGNGQIELQLSPDFLPRPDHFTLLNADFSLELTSNGGLGFVQLFSRVNDSLTRYNNTALFIGFEQSWRRGDWSGKGTALTGWVSLGGELYQRQSQLQMRINPPLRLSEHWQLGFSGNLSSTKYQTLTNFNANSLELRAHLGWRSGPSALQASTGYLLDRGTAARPGGDRRGWLSSVQWRSTIRGNLLGDVGWTHQTWHGESDYSPGFIDQRRDQKTDILRAGLQYPIGARQSLQLEWRQTWNRENISLFQYQNHQLQLNWLMSW
jgi:hypothetical protein